MADHAQLFHQLWISGVLIAATTFVHAVFVSISAAVLRRFIKKVGDAVRVFRDSFVLVLLTLWLMAAHCLEIWLWAYAYLRLDLFGSVEQALYFAAVSYTTLGFGDVLLPEDWGLLSGAAAANGLLLFGLSAAFLVETSARLRLGDR